jgi:MarR family
MLRKSAVANEQPSHPSSLRSWSFITNHAQILLAVARDPGATVAQLADTAEITERSAYRILADLQRAGYVQRGKLGRHNVYEISLRLPLRDPTVENERVRDLLRLVTDAGDEGIDRRDRPTDLARTPTGST